MYRNMCFAFLYDPVLLLPNFPKQNKKKLPMNLAGTSGRRRPEPHYRKPAGCRVPEALPCATYRAHGKHSLCRVPKRQHTAKDPTHGKAHVCRVPGFLTHGKGDTHSKRARMPCVRKMNTRQK